VAGWRGAMQQVAADCELAGSRTEPRRTIRPPSVVSDRTVGLCGWAGQCTYAKPVCRRSERAMLTVVLFVCFRGWPGSSERA